MKYAILHIHDEKVKDCLNNVNCTFTSFPLDSVKSQQQYPSKKNEKKFFLLNISKLYKYYIFKIMYMLYILSTINSLLDIVISLLYNPKEIMKTKCRNRIKFRRENLYPALNGRKSETSFHIPCTSVRFCILHTVKNVTRLGRCTKSRNLARIREKCE